MKARTSLNSGQSTLHRFKAHLPGTHEPIRLLAECSMDAIAQIVLKYAPSTPWELVLVLDGAEVGIWEIEPHRASEPPPWPSTLSPTVRARVVGL